MNYVTQLITGNEAIGLGAVLAGCRYYFGYPITPQNELTEYMSRNIPAAGGQFIQSESELAAINMVMGAAAAGGRAMTSSSSPGISLMQEGISYMAGMELPCVIANVVRGGPGLGGIGPAQSDYFQATKGGGHGDYYTPVLAPHTVQEMLEFTIRAFDVADEYRSPTMILSDGLLGQMSEAIKVPTDYEPEFREKKWAMTGCAGRPPSLIRSLFLDPEELEEHNLRLDAKYKRLQKEAADHELFRTRGAELLLVAYGTSGRLCKAVVEKARNDGLKVGLFRPKTLFPFSEKALRKMAGRVRAILVVELSMGQLLQDVQRIVGGVAPVYFKGRPGGVILSTSEIYQEVKKLYAKLQNESSQ